MSNRVRPVIVALATLAVAIAATVALHNDSNSNTARTPTPNAPTSDTRGSESTRHSDLPTISVNELPDEAVDVLALIDDDGPFAHSQDGAIFQNREGILPSRGSSHYREYTVETPGSSDRGARRIVAGADDERYYTDDHYESFREIVS
ncbi:MAG: ribonuclease N1 [Acidimicrobiia bacterium]|nr:ribonuclease N1 [Acidimicrobiia bacterium]